MPVSRFTHSRFVAPRFAAPLIYPRAGTVKAFAYVANGYTTTNQTSQSFNVSIGAEDATRIVIFAIYSQGAAGALTHSSVTIGGSAATLVVQNANGNARLGLYRAAVPTGTTATIAWTTSANSTNSGCLTFRAIGLTSDTPADTASNNGAGGSLSAILDAPLNGAILAAAITVADSTNIAWTNATEQFERSAADELRGTAAIYQTPGALESNKTVSADPVRVIVAGSWT